MVRSVLVLALACACGGASKPATTAPTPDNILVLVDDRGVALGGNDAIAYTTGAVEEGSPEHTSTYATATYQFASPEHKQAFDADPVKHAPAFGGYCAFAASQNRLSEADPTVYMTYEGQLLMFTNEDFRAQFQQAPAANKQKADANWPGLVAKHGKPGS